MNRRDVLAAGFSLATLATVDKALAVRPCPPTLSGTQPVECSRLPTSARWDWNVPSLQDETDFYNNIMGWTIPAGAENFSGWSAANLWGFGNMHNNTEGDALWLWDQQQKRHGSVTVPNGNDTTQKWRDELLTEYKSSLLSALDANDGLSASSGYGYDHLYGQGLSVIYNDTSDATILPVLDGLRSRITGISEYNTLDQGGTLLVSFWAARCVARWALVTAYATQATNDPAWIDVRDNLQRAYETSPDWEEGGVIANGGGCYFASRTQAINSGGADEPAAYDSGRRYNAAFYIGIITEAMWRMFIQTGSTILRDRLIKIARYVQHYAHKPSWSFPNVGDRFGHEGDGSIWHLQDGDGTLNNCVKDSSHDISIVNTMIIGYKLTGDSSMLTFARTLFSRGNRYFPYPGQNYPLAALSLNHVYKYVDTIPDPTNSRFQWNKGQLQYCYMIFENGGNPQVL